MPATILETNPVPFTKVAIDPVTLDIIENALRNARIETRPWCAPRCRPVSANRAMPFR